MGPTARLYPLAITCVAATSLAFAQQRAPTFFVVNGTDGRSRAGAEVTCVAAPNPLHPGAPDVQRATTDERGRARCTLLVGRLYEAWAVTAPADDGSAFASAIQARIVAGQVLELRAADACAKRRVRLPGLGAWHLPEARKLRWLPVADIDLWIDVPLPGEDAIDVAPSPLATSCVCVLDAAGQAIATTTVSANADTAVGFPAPRRVVVHAVDASGAPIAGAIVEHSLPRGGEPMPFMPRAGELQRTVGVTDDDGTLACLVPRLDVGDVTLFVGKRGWAWSVQRVLSDAPMTFHLQEAQTSTIRVLGGPSSGVAVFVHGSATMQESSGRYTPHTLHTALAADGRWTIEHAGARIGLCVGCPDELPLQLQVDPHAGVIEVDLRGAAIDAQVLDAAGGLTACAVAVGQRERSSVSWLGVLATDLAGRLHVRVPPGDLVLYATTGTHHALALVDRTRRTPHELRLQPVPTMQVRVRDGNGKPVAGTTADIKGMTWQPPPADPLDAAWHAVAVYSIRGFFTSTRGDEDGIIRIPALVVPSLQVGVVVTNGTRTSAPFQLSPGETLELTLN